MPIQTAVPVRCIGQDEYSEVDRVVTGIGFDIHNKFGRYLDESNYKRELTRRCIQFGFNVTPEMQIVVSLDDFRKPYFVDHLVNNSVVVESKAVATLNASHRAQTLNYLFLCEVMHGTLLNFRPERVEHEFVSTTLTREDRQQIDFNTTNWKELSGRCHELRRHLERTLLEWGAFLDPILYRDALTHFLGGKDQVCQSVPVYSSNHLLGYERANLITEAIAFSVTASVRHPDSVLVHQQKFLAHTSLAAIHWINLNHHLIELHTIQQH